MCSTRRIGKDRYHDGYHERTFCQTFQASQLAGVYLLLGIGQRKKPVKTVWFEWCLPAHNTHGRSSS